MTTQLYLQKAEMQLSRGLEEKALESLLAALACQDRDTVSETQMRCLLGEYQFVHQQYVQAQEQFSWISDAKLNCFSLAKTLKIILPLYICKASCLAGDRMKGDGRHERIYLQKL